MGSDSNIVKVIDPPALPVKVVVVPIIVISVPGKAVTMKSAGLTIDEVAGMITFPVADRPPSGLTVIDPTALLSTINVPKLRFCAVITDVLKATSIGFGGCSCAKAGI